MVPPRRVALIVAEVVLCVALLGAGFAARHRLGKDWAFLGADSYAYMGAAMELSEHHLFGFRKPPWLSRPGEQTPPGYCRMPGYALFLAAVANPDTGERAEKGRPASYDAMVRRAKLAQAALELLTGLLAFAAARRLAGRLAALLTLALIMADPFLALYSASVLTETLATFLTTAVMLALFVVLDDCRAERRTLWLCLAAAALALSSLTRIDGIVLLPSLLLPWLLGAVGRRQALLAGLVFCVCFAPWPLRNLHRFGAAHPLAGVCDISGEAMPRTSFFRWFATWVVQEEQTPSTLYCLLRPSCQATVNSYPPEAFDSPAEREQLARLFSLRRSEGLSERVDQGFRALALQRLRRHPLRTLVVLPLRRAYAQWVSRDDQPLRATNTTPWPAVIRPLSRHLRQWSGALLLGGLCGLALLFVLPRFRPWRKLALLLCFTLLLRAAFLSLIGFVDARYILEVHPLLALLSAVALSQLLLALRRLISATASDTA